MLSSLASFSSLIDLATRVRHDRVGTNENRGSPDNDNHDDDCGIEFDDNEADTRPMTTVEKAFHRAAGSVRAFAAKPGLLDSATLLQLYALYKQATVGDSAGVPRPPFWEPQNQRKYDAWHRLKGMTEETAMQGYIDAVDVIVRDHPDVDVGKAGGGAGYLGVGVSRPQVPDGDDGGTDAGRSEQCEEERFIQAVKAGDVGAMEEVVDSVVRAAGGAPERTQDRTPLVSALLAIVDDSSLTPLHHAVDRGHLKVVQWILSTTDKVGREAGHDSLSKTVLHATDEDGQTPAHYAVTLDRPEILRELIAAGADVAGCLDCDGCSVVTLSQDIEACAEVLRELGFDEGGGC